MSKTVTIPTDGMNPFVVIHNGVKYVYTPGETVTVPDGVALEIEEYKRWRDKYYGITPKPFGAQPDLSQNDPDAADYVKGRTHYEEFKTIIEEREVRVWRDGGEFAVSRIPQVGEMLTVTFNGNTYKCTAWESNGNVGLGNGEAFGINKGENVPFFAGFWENDEEGTGAFIVSTITGENTISIVDNSGNTLLEETFNIEFYADESVLSAEFPLDQPLIVGNTYKVVYDGVPYECVAWESEGDIGLGNGEIDGYEHSEDVPFMIGTSSANNESIWWLVFYGVDSHIVSISEVVVHKLDKKYLPDDIGGEKYDMVIDYPGSSDEMVIEQGSFEAVKAKILASESVNAKVYNVSYRNTYHYPVLRIMYDEEDEEIEITVLSYTGEVLKLYWKP